MLTALPICLLVVSGCGGGGSVAGPSGISGSLTVEDACVIEEHAGFWQGTLGANPAVWLAQQGPCSREMTGVFELAPGPNVRRGTMQATFQETKLLRITITFDAGTFPAAPACAISWTGPSTSVETRAITASLTYTATEACVGVLTMATTGTTAISLTRPVQP